MHHINQTHASGNSERTIESSSSKREEDVETKYEETVLQKQEKYQRPCVQKASEQEFHTGGVENSWQVSAMTILSVAIFDQYAGGTGHSSMMLLSSCQFRTKSRAHLSLARLLGGTCWSMRSEARRNS